MGATLRHFSVNADDVEAARQFYGPVLGRTFEAWGLPNFSLVSNGDGGVEGSLQGRRDLIGGEAMVGIEATFAVDGVDDLIWFGDPAGKAVGVMGYDPQAP